MHRSGTSFAAHALQLLGVSLGNPDYLMAPGRDNPSGYWENQPIKSLDDELLAELGGSWDQPPVLGPGWEHAPELDELRREADAILERSFGPAGGEGFLAWKDPRLSLLLPFWQTVRPVTATVLLVRHPTEVASSLAARNGIETPQAAVLWLRYVLAALGHKPTPLVLRNTDFTDDLPRTIAALADHVGVDRPSAEVEATIAATFDPTLRHHVAGDTEPTEPLMALAHQVWNGGRVDEHALDDTLARCLAEGWLRPPSDGELLAQARAKVMKLQATMARRSLQKKKLDEQRAVLAQASSAVDDPPPAADPGA
jgi:hypothetical protein